MQGATGEIAPRPHGGLYCWDSGPPWSAPWRRLQRFPPGPSKGGIDVSDEAGEAGVSNTGRTGPEVAPGVSLAGSDITWVGQSSVAEVGSEVYIDVRHPPKGMVGNDGTYCG